MKKIISVACSLLLFTLMACTKHAGDAVEPPPAATIAFASPTVNSVYRSGDSVSIKATAIAKATIHGYDVVVKSATDTTVYFSKHVHDHNDTLFVDQKWKASVGGPLQLQAKIVLTLDHEGHTAEKSVSFGVQ